MEAEFIEEHYTAVCDAIRDFAEAAKDDVYAISFWKYNFEDDPRKPVLSISYNTQTQAKEQAAKASNAAEAKWNFAFWRQSDDYVIGSQDGDILEWVRDLPEFYDRAEDAEDYEEDEEDSDDEESDGDDEESERRLEADDVIQEKFMDMIVDMASRLHSEGVVKKAFGREIPIIIHELEYYKLPLSWTKRANPPGLIAEFEAWVKSL